MKKILVIIDMQNDFITGSIPIANASNIIPIINKLHTEEEWYKVIITLDTHNGIQEPWPLHCIKHTEGHKLHKDIIVLPTDIIVEKNENSAFNSIQQYIDGCGDHDKYGHEQVCLYLCGVSKDYCVKETYEDLLMNGYNVEVIEVAIM